ncbi:retrovirus-related pol polyprotein from transposon TNT 1-94 [Tanacetum coccineum]
MSQDVLITVMNSMSLNNNSVNMEMLKCDSCEKCLNLDAELSKSKQAYNDLLKNHSQLEQHCISLEVSMQSKQEVSQNDESCINQNAVEIQEYFEINDLKAWLQDKDKTICKLKDTIKSLRENTKEENVNHDKWEIEPINKELEIVFKDQFDSIKQTRVHHKEQWKEIVENVVHTPSVTTIAPGMFKLDLEPLPPRLLQNRKVHIDYLRNTQEQANIFQEIELLVYVQDTCPNAITPNTRKVAVMPMNNVNKVRFAEPLTSSSNSKHVESSYTSDSNTPVLSSTRVKCSTRNCRSKPPGNKKNDRISQTPSRNKKNKVIQIVLWYLDSGCSKHMIGNHSQLMNFVSKFLGTVRFGNDQIVRIMRFLKTKDEAHAAIIKCIKNIQVRLKATVRNVRTDNGTEFVNQILREWYENVGISHQASVARTPQQNGVVERRNRTLIEAARTMLIFNKAPLFLWAEAINTTFYTQNHSLICFRYNKTPYELMQDKKPDLSFFYVFGSLCYPSNDNVEKDLIYKAEGQYNTETIHVTFDELTTMASEQFSSGSGLQGMTPATSSTRLVQKAAAPRANIKADSPVSTSMIKKCPSISIPHHMNRTLTNHFKVLKNHQKKKKTPTFHDDPLNESPHEESTSQGSSSNMRQLHTPLEHLGR